MMKTPEQLKGAIRNLAKKKGIHAQEVLQIFMFERIIERLSVSPYKDRLIFKRRAFDFCHPRRSGTDDNGYGHNCKRLTNG